MRSLAEATDCSTLSSGEHPFPARPPSPYPAPAAKNPFVLPWIGAAERAGVEAV
jgi:hypothetical protein